MNHLPQITSGSAAHVNFINSVERQIRARFEASGLKQSSIKWRTEEATLIVGAMMALEALAPNEQAELISPLSPPRWYMSAMTGRSVLDMEPLKFKPTESKPSVD